MSKTGARTSLTYLTILAIGRFIIDTAQRMVYPFLPELARGLNVSLEQMQNLIGWSSVIALLSTLIVPLSERFGRKPFLLISYAIFVVGCIIIVIFPTYWFFGAVLILITAAKRLFNPNVHATIADIVPYERRGRIMAMIEVPWGLALLIGAPAVGWLIVRYGWYSPYMLFAIFGVIIFVLMWRTIPETLAGREDGTAVRQSFWQTIKAHPSIIAAGIHVLCHRCANQLLFISYADWMEQKFAFTVTSLGLLAVLIGVSELIGEGVVSGFSDRIGKKRFVIWSSLLSAVGYALLPLAGNSQPFTLTILFVIFLMGEIAIVGSLPIYSELAPKARTVTLAIVGLSASLGISIGAFMTPVLSHHGGFHAINFAAGLITVVSVFVLSVGIKESRLLS